MEALLEATREACSARTWSRGVELARSGAVVLVRRDEREAELRVANPGRAASATVTIWPDDEDWSCDCGGTEDPCSHVAAAVIALKHAKTAEPSAVEPTLGERPPLAARIAYELGRSPDGLCLRRLLVGETTTVLRSSIAGLAASRGSARIAASRQDLSAELALGQRVQGGLLPPGVLRKLLEVLRDGADVRLDGVPVRIGAACPALEVELVDDGPGFRLRARRDGLEGDEVFANGALLRAGTLCARVEPDLPPDELKALRAGVYVPPDQAGRLAMELLPRLAGRLPVDVQTSRLPRAEAARPRLALELARDRGQLRVLPTLVYGDPPRARLDGERMTLLGAPDQPVPLRDEAAEQRLRERLSRELGLRLGQPQLYPPEEAIPLVDRLRHARDLMLSGAPVDEFKLAAPLEPHWAVGERAFDMTFRPRGGAGQTVSADEVFRVWRAGGTVVPLPSGGFAPLPHDWLERYGPRIGALLALRDENNALAPAALPELAELSHELEAPLPPSLGRLRERLADFSHIPAADPPADLTAELRGYQREGLAWLSFMRDNELGALLADDMGLGKTLQAMCALRRAERSLVIAPTSVLGNWRDELARFRPSLSACLYHGPDRRLEPGADVTLTSYALLRLDLDRLAACEWDVVVLDEAQNIRNPESQVAQAAFSLRARWRLALSGTPVENRLDDLWSQFHFLNRGLLAGRSDFSERYARPIAEGRSDLAAELRRRTRPFVLRRLKHDVERELPPRTEVVLRCQLSPPEREIYRAIEAATRKDVLERLQLDGNVLAALAALLRLRQAACHPGLIPGQEATTSSKLELLGECLEEAHAEGHKSLVFSQWTSLLDLIEPALRARGQAFLRLDGTTRDRHAVVSRFQQPDGPPVLLISLKAGGVGLNLTQADHVFLLDPWWNPAAEDQAADRAHRIGQTRPVIVHRLVSEETVEERILELQQHKRSLAAAALEGAAEAGSLSREDLLQLLAG